MTRQDRERWDSKYAARGAEVAPVTPVDAFLAAALEQLGPGAQRTALDLAAGTGRHALELARRDWRVTAWDVSPVGLALLTRRAADAGLDVETRAVDLVDPERPPPDESFDLVVIVNFLERPLLARVADLVRPGGHLLFVTFTVDRPGAKPPLQFCLERGELARGLPGFETLLTDEHDGRAGLLGRRRG